jgi:regulatory protein
MIEFSITRIEVPRGRPDRRRVILETQIDEGVNGSGEVIRIDLPASEIARRGLAIAGRITDAERRELEALAEVDRCRARTVRLLSKRMRSEEELRRSLVRADFSYLAIRIVLKEFADSGIVDDRIFAEQFADQRRRLKGHAPARIEMELRTRGVDRETAHRAAWQPYEEDSVDTESRQLDEAIVLLNRRRGRYTGLPADVARRRMAALLGRAGYTTSVSLDAVDAVLEQMGTEQLLSESNGN